jgi:hypothetical protein
MSGDGTGYEFLTQEQLVDHQKRIQRQHRTALNPSALACEPAAQAPAQHLALSKLNTRKKRVPYIDEAPSSPRAPSSQRVSNSSDSQSLILCEALPQLSLARVSMSPLVEQNNKFKEIQASKKKKGQSQQQRLSEWRFRLEERVENESPVTAKDRVTLAQADIQYAEWKQDLLANEDRFNVDDMRPESVVQEESKMQSLINKERRRMRRAERKKERRDDRSSTQASLAISESVNTTCTSQRGSSTNQRMLLSEADWMLPEGEEEDLGEELEGAEYSGELPELQDEDEQLDARPPVPSPRNSPMNADVNFWQTIKSGPLDE